MNNPAAFADLLAEKPPFLKLPDSNFSRTGNTITIQLRQAKDYRLQDLTDLMLLTGTMGALNLALCHSGHASGYILAEGLRIVRYSDCDNTAALYADITSTLLSDRKGRGFANITSDTGAVIYSMAATYHIFKKGDFEKIFSQHRQADLADMVQDIVLPVVENRLSADASVYYSHIRPFTHQHCIGHFPGYPCVPASFILRCLITGILQWWQQHMQTGTDQLCIDNAEIFTTRMIPLETPLAGATRVIQTSRWSRKFIVTLEDEKDATTVYGHYIIDLRELPLS